MKKCRLCGFQRKLCKSHILPEFLYKNLYDARHQLIELSASESHKIRVAQKGAWERLLCQDCEKKLSGWETYAKMVLSARVPITMVRVSGRPVVEIAALDYVKLKLFQLSILWRSSITSHKFFTGVKLLPKEERRIQKMLSEDDPGQPSQFPCLAIINSQYGQILQEIIMNPENMDADDGQRYCRFAFGGMFWFYVIPSVPQELVDDKLVISNKGIWRMPIENKFSSEFFRSCIDAFHHSGNLVTAMTRTDHRVA